jgi:hypothetical protein
MQQFGHGVRESRVCFGTPRLWDRELYLRRSQSRHRHPTIELADRCDARQSGRCILGNAPVWDALYQRPNADIRQRRVSLEMGVAPHAMSLSMALRANFLQDSTRP